jgi:hypothetical protein
LRAASIKADVTAVGGGAAALMGSANIRPVVDNADAFSTSRLDHLRSPIAVLP